MKYIKLYEEFNKNELRIGSIVEFHVPDKKINHTGKVISFDDETITLIDDKTDEEITLNMKEVVLGYV